jgi:hypothetical protein
VILALRRSASEWDTTSSGRLIDLSFIETWKESETGRVPRGVWTCCSESGIPIYIIFIHTSDFVQTQNEAKLLKKLKILAKSLLCNVAAFTGMPYISKSSNIQSLFL